jgi:hypothetical protein
MSLSTLGATLIPCPLCDALPYDNPRELASHLESECPGRNGPAAPAPAPEPTERRDPVRIGGYAETFTPVRSFSPGGTRATITPSARIANPCSDKQEAFIRSLCDRTGADLPDFATLTKAAASKVIDGLKSQPAKTPAAPAASAAPSHGIELEHGRVYAMADGTFVKVVESKAGNLYGLPERPSGPDRPQPDRRRSRSVRPRSPSVRVLCSHAHRRGRRSFGRSWLRAHLCRQVRPSLGLTPQATHDRPVGRLDHLRPNGPPVRHP